MPQAALDRRERTTPALFPAALSAAGATEIRPFYLNVVLWGRRFRDYFLDYCLPSLLAPGNLPSLEGKSRHRFLICTTRADWDALTATRIFAVLREHIEPVWVEIPEPLPGVGGCQHMGVGHKLATQRAFADRACLAVLTPDLVLSDGSLRALQRHAQAGKRVVLVAAMRFAEEPLFAELRQRGHTIPGRPASATGRPLVLPPRELTAMALKSFHSETANYEWDAPFGAALLPLCIWRVQGEAGLIVHSFSWAPFMMDYGGLERHDTNCLESWTLDGDYVFRNFTESGKVHVVTDSDEVMMVSWAPLGDRPQSTAPRPAYARPALRELLKGWLLETTYHSDIMDPLKRRLFPTPVFWHAGDLGPEYEATARRAARGVRAGMQAGGLAGLGAGALAPVAALRAALGLILYTQAECLSVLVLALRRARTAAGALRLRRRLRRAVLKVRRRGGRAVAQVLGERAAALRPLARSPLVLPILIVCSALAAPVLLGAALIWGLGAAALRPARRWRYVCRLRGFLDQFA